MATPRSFPSCDYLSMNQWGGEEDEEREGRARDGSEKWDWGRFSVRERQRFLLDPSCWEPNKSRRRDTCFLCTIIATLGRNLCCLTEVPCPSDIVLGRQFSVCWHNMLRYTGPLEGPLAFHLKLTNTQHAGPINRYIHNTIVTQAWSLNHNVEDSGSLISPWL
jgi:hypothetical protein